MHAYIAWRLLPIVLVSLSAAFWFNDVQGGGEWVPRNWLPLLLLVTLVWLVLYKGQGRWAGAGYQWPIATLGFAIPALGLSVYLHYAYSVNLNGMFSDAQFPERIFRFLPIYTMGAGLIGFAIGWIVGRKV